MSSARPPKPVLSGMRQPKGARLTARRTHSRSRQPQLHPTGSLSLSVFVRHALDIPRQQHHQQNLPPDNHPPGADSRGTRHVGMDGCQKHSRMLSSISHRDDACVFCGVSYVYGAFYDDGSIPHKNRHHHNRNSNPAHRPPLRPMLWQHV